ncbi:hypothetical protein Tco_0815281 [Tanacetum coccineum]
MEDSKQSHSVSSGTVLDPQDPRRNIQLTSMGLPFTSPDEGIRKSQPLPEGPTTDLKDSGGNVQPADTRLPSTVPNEGTAKTTSYPEGPLGDKDSEGNKTPANMEPINPSVADPSGTGAEYQVDETHSTRLRYQILTKNEGKTSFEESDEGEVLATGEDMDKDNQADEKKHQSPPSNTHKPESSHAQNINDSDNDSSSPDILKKICEDQWEKHEEAAVSYADLKAFIEGYYAENVDHMEQTDDLVKATMNSLDKKRTKRADLLKALNGNSTNLTELLTLVKSFDFNSLMSVVESLKATTLSQDKHLAEWAKSSTSMAWNLGLRLTAIKHSQATIRSEVSSLNVPPTLALIEIPTSVEEENDNTTTKEHHSHTEGEHADMETDTEKLESKKAAEEPKHATSISIVPTPNSGVKIEFIGSSRPQPTETPTTEAQPITTIISMPHPKSSQATKRTDKGKKIATEEQLEIQTKLFKASSVVQEDPDEPIREETEKIGIDPKKVITTKAGEKFKKAQDAEMQVHKRQHTEKVKRLIELNKKRAEQYKWTISSILKLEPITDVKIHPNSRHALLTVYRNNDKRNFKVHNPFKYAKFGITELDELGLIIKKKKNFIVKDLMKSLGKRYKRLKKITEELGIQFALAAPIPAQALSQSSRRKRKHMELEPKIKIHGMECNRSLPKGVPFVNNMVIEEPEDGMFFIDVFGDQAFQR